MTESCSKVLKWGVVVNQVVSGYSPDILIGHSLNNHNLSLTFCFVYLLFLVPDFYFSLGNVLRFGPEVAVALKSFAES